jgi:hypothetical protein
MSELSLAVEELQRCGEALIGVSASLAALFGSSDEPSSVQPQTPTPVPEPKREAKPVTLEQVRSVLAEKSQDGFTAEVRGLLEKHSATKLSQIDPSEYSTLLAEAEALK